MSEAGDLILATTERVFASDAAQRAFSEAENGAWPAGLWTSIVGTGLDRLGMEADLGFGDVLAVIRAAGAAALPVPLAETIIAQFALRAADLAVPDGPMSVAPVIQGDELQLTRTGDGWAVSARLRRVPWGRQAGSIVAIAMRDGRPTTVRLDRFEITRRGTNLAGEARDDVTVDHVPLAPDGIGSFDHGWSPSTLRAGGALMRSTAMAGAMATLLDMTVRYATERVQFGKPIARFQAVQQQLAVMAGEAASANAAAAAAISAGSLQGDHFHIAVAKARTGEAAERVAAIAHAVHGAIGFTAEHRLNRFTRRLWSWREEFGDETEWAAQVARLVITRGGEDLWSRVTQSQQ